MNNMFNTQSNIEEAPSERKINISGRGIQPPNVRDDSVNDYTSKGYDNKEILRLRHLILHFTEWFRPLISDVLSQEVNLAKFEELAMEGVSEIVVCNELLREENLADFGELPMEGISEIVVSNALVQEEDLSKSEELALEGVSEIVGRKVFAQEENLTKFEELKMEGTSEIVVSNALVQEENPSKSEELTLEGVSEIVGSKVFAQEEDSEIVVHNVISQEENLTNFEELEVEGASEIVVSNELSQEENLAKFEELTIEGVSGITVSNALVQEENPSKFDELVLEGVNEIVGSNVFSREENLLKFEELALGGVGVIVFSNALSQEENPSKFEELALGVGEIVGSNAFSQEENLSKFEEPALEGVGEIIFSNAPSQEENLAKFDEELAVEGASEITVNNTLVQEENPSKFDELALEGVSEIVGSNVFSQVENLSKFEELALEGVDEIVFSKTLSQEENLVKFEEFTVEGVNETVVRNIPDQGENLEKFEQLTLEGNRPPIEQRDDHLNDHHSMQYKNNNDNEETSRLEENLAKFEELAQGGIIETATPFTLVGMRESVEQQNLSIIEHTKVCEGDAKGGEGYVEYPHAGDSDPNNDSDDEIEQIKVDAITSQRQDAPLLSHGKAIQSPSTSQPSTKQPLIELAEEEIEMEQTTCYKNEALSARCGTPNEGSRISPSMSVQQQEENGPSNIRRLDLNGEPTSDIAIEVETIVRSSLSRETIRIAEINKQKVLKWLSEKDVQIVRIEGNEGSGRTWMARQVVHAAVETGPFDIVIWLNVGSSYNFQDMMMQIIDQLKLSSTMMRAVREMTEKSLQHDIAAILAEKSFLLILDDAEGFSLNDLDKLGVPLPSKRRNKSSKVLFIGRTHISSNLPPNRVLSLNPLHFDEAWLLFCDKVGVAFDSPDSHSLAEDLVHDCYGVTLDIILLAGALRNIKGDTSLTLGTRLKMAYNLRTIDLLTITEISCAMLPSKVMKDCFLYCTLYPKYHHINVKGLITSWIIEGFIEGFDCLEDAYEEGKHILKELIDHYLLYKSDDSHVMVHDCLHYMGRNYILEHERSDIILAKASVRLIIPELYTEQDSFRKIYLMDGSLQTKYLDCQEFPKSSTLLFHGRNVEGTLSTEIPDAFFQKMQNLQILTLLHVGTRSLPSSLSNLKELYVLVLRGCGTLENLNHIRGLTNLKVLNLSGAHALKEIADDFFVTMRHLEALDLSDTHIKKLPTSLSNLFDLCHLILRGCSYLEELPHLKAAKHLKVLDLSGTSSLRKIDDRLFEDKTSLKQLHLSGTVFDRFPPIFNLNGIHYFSLRGCSCFDMLPCLEAFTSLKVLDLSGTRSLRKFQDKSFEMNSYLRILDLSGTQVVQLPSLSKCFRLRQLFLRGCSNLKTLPPLHWNLRLLDLSGSTAFKNFQDESLECKLQILNLSGTRIVHLPAIPTQSRLRQLLLRSCLNLQTLPPLANLRGLEEIDLSGSTAFQKFNDGSFAFSLRILNLSETQVAQLPSLSKCTGLSQLLLRDCLKLKVLPNLDALTKLEVLDLSGATAFKKLPDESFGQKNCLQKLDLSGTQVEKLPSLSKCTGLSQLLLRGCLKLKSLENLDVLTKLEVLDLSGVPAFRQFPDESFEQKIDLKKLDLSGTPVENLQFLSKCSGLCQLLLRGCSNLETLPPLEALTKLEVLNLSGATAFRGFPDEFFMQKNDLKKLDLSGTQVEQLTFLYKCTRLSRLLLRSCSKLETLPPLQAFRRLEELDLFGATAFRRFPDESVGQKNGLPECSDLSKPFLNESFKTEWGDIMNVSKEDGCRSCIRVTASNSDVLHSICNNSQLWEKCFQRFNLCLCSIEKQGKEDDIYFQGKEFVFKDTYYTQTRWLPQSTVPDNFLEICGFQSFPSGIEGILNCVELLFLRQNASITRLSDIGTENVKVMRECWIERCDGMESVFYGDETEENVALGRCLQSLWVSNLSELRTLCEGVAQSGSFTCLKNLYLDCCPSLITVFSSGLELKNLETLQIKFCEEFECVFGEMVLGESALPRLRKLTLWKLSELKSICGGVLPSLRNLKVGGCPKLQTLPLEVNRTNRPQIEIQGELEWWEELKLEDEGIWSHLHFEQL